MLSVEEVAEIKKNWEILRVNPSESGAAILTCFFNKYPSNIKYFPFRETPITELNSNPKFTKHSTRIIGSFEESIQALGNDGWEAKVQSVWDTIAVSHVKRHHIPKAAYNQLREAIVETVSRVCQLNDFQKQAWNKLLDHVYNIIFTKYDELGAE